MELDFLKNNTADFSHEQSTLRICIVYMYFPYISLSNLKKLKFFGHFERTGLSGKPLCRFFPRKPNFNFWAIYYHIMVYFLTLITSNTILR